MNFHNYLFEGKEKLEKDLLLGPERLSYSDLLKYSNLLSRKIREIAGQNQEILLISANNVFFIIVYLAIIRSGNICIPLNPAIEQDNLQFILNQTNSTILFVEEKLKSKFLFLQNIQIFNSENINYADFQGLSDFHPVNNKNDIAEIIYTSGSTGIPKGVMISHGNLISNTNSILGYLPIEKEDRILIVLPFYYCYGLSLLHTHIKAGAQIVFNNSFFFLGKVIKDLADYKCTTFAGVPSHFQILLRKTKDFKNMVFPNLKYVTQAGGYLPSVFIDEFKSNFPDTSFFVMYGQTEATARLSYLNPDNYETKKDSIGKAIPDVILKVINKNFEEEEVNKTGEIIASGDNIMKGYYKDTESTNNTLKNGWLHTGDLGYMDEDGFIFLVARKKEIIKVGGKRVSPKEIENVILKIEDVINCKIYGMQDEVLGEAIGANVVLTKGSKTTVKQIIEHCNKYLASYKVPKTIEINDNLKLNEVGKKI